MDIYRKRSGPDHPNTAHGVRVLADHYLRCDEASKALPQFVEAARAIEASQGAESGMLDRPLVGIGDSYMTLEQPAQAIASYERALHVLAGGSNIRFLNVVKFSLAQALLRARRDPARSRALASEARAYFASQGPDEADMVTEIDAFLRRR